MHSTTVNSIDDHILNVVFSLRSEQFSTSNRIIELINERIIAKKPFYSIEVCPTVGRSDPILDLDRFEKPPLFVSIAWLGQQFSGPETLNSTPALLLARRIFDKDRQRHILPVLLHITCERMTADGVSRVIGDYNVQNVLALRGDHVDPVQPMQHASDLVQHIRNHCPRTCVAIAGYPEVHPQASAATTDLQYLLHKCKAGADFIITQVCFSASAILRFVAQCRLIGCQVPIVIGLYVPASYLELQAMLRICGCRTSEDSGPVADELRRYHELATNTFAFQAYAVRETRRRMSQLLASDGAIGFHFFTMNRFDLVQRCVEDFGFE